MSSKKRKKAKKRRRPAALIARGLLAGAAAACAFGLFVFFGLPLLKRPAFTLKARSLVMEAGTEFDPYRAVEFLKDNVSQDLTIDDGGFQADVPGIYDLVYTIGEESRVLSIFVKDTTAPSLTLRTGTVEALTGDVLAIDDVVAEVSDLSGASAHFEDGADTMEFVKDGQYPVRVVAEDIYGNRTDDFFNATVTIPDTTAPTIEGVTDGLIQAGDPFDVLSGVTVTDDRDPSPALTCEPESIDTSAPGEYVITYEAHDADGNSAQAQRRIRVAEHVIRIDGEPYEIYWDPAGVEGQPYLVATNRVTNTVTVYAMDENGRYTVPVRAFLCSTGPATPAGYFRTQERYRWRALFEESFGQYAIRIQDHILFHSVPYYWESPDSLEYEEFNLLGTSASLGCIRLACADEKWLYDNCPDGFPCVIYDAEDPGPLGKPDPIWLDVNDEARRGWDPTDPDPNNPWNQ